MPDASMFQCSVHIRMHPFSVKRYVILGNVCQDSGYFSKMTTG
jgi:hypothetical protein